VQQHEALSPSHARWKPNPLERSRIAGVNDSARLVRDLPVDAVNRGLCVIIREPLAGQNAGRRGLLYWQA
jgi:hypothetical protein